MTRIGTRRLGTLVTLVALLIAACGSGPDPSRTPAPSGEPAPARRPVIIDTDVGLDDIGAMLVMLRDPELDVRAITIAGTGLAHCQGGRLVVSYLLDELGASHIPYGCGRVNGGPDARPFPEEWRGGADAGYGLPITPKVTEGTPREAGEVLIEAVDGSPSAPTIVALGPLTNLEDAFAADPTLPDRIAGVHAMLGSVDGRGNVTIDDVTEDVPVEWNAFADPSAVEAVFATEVPITLVPLDATADVPVPADLAARLESNRAAAGADFMYELLVRNPYLMDPANGQFLWDELAALTLTDPDLAEWGKASVTVGDRGQLVRDEAAGRSVNYATGADRPAVETALVEALGRGGPRANPLQEAGTVQATYDGTTCSAEATVDEPGLANLSFTGPRGTPSGVLIVGVRPPSTWADLEALASTFDPETMVTPPPWLIQAGQAADDNGTGEVVTAIADLESGTYGPVCTDGTWPDFTLVPGTPFEVPG
jgi:pyrimidine-specific ribonucleoside hydrolase